MPRPVCTMRFIRLTPRAIILPATWAAPHRPRNLRTRSSGDCKAEPKDGPGTPVLLAARQSERANSLMQIRALHAESSRRARDVPARFFECAQNVFAFSGFPRFLNGR